jgi:hypothetical protein
LRLLDLNAELKSAHALPNSIEFTYSSTSRAIAIFDRPVTLVIDGQPAAPDENSSIFLPRGAHAVAATIRNKAAP